MISSACPTAPAPTPVRCIVYLGEHGIARHLLVGTAYALACAAVAWGASPRVILARLRRGRCP